MKNTNDMAFSGAERQWRLCLVHFRLFHLSFYPSLEDLEENLKNKKYKQIWFWGGRKIFLFFFLTHWDCEKEVTAIIYYPLLSRTLLFWPCYLSSNRCPPWSPTEKARYHSATNRKARLKSLQNLCKNWLLKFNANWTWLKKRRDRDDPFSETQIGQDKRYIISISTETMSTHIYWHPPVIPSL